MTINVDKLSLCKASELLSPSHFFLSLKFIFKIAWDCYTAHQLR